MFEVTKARGKSCYGVKDSKTETKYSRCTSLKAASKKARKMNRMGPTAVRKSSRIRSVSSPLPSSRRVSRRRRSPRRSPRRVTRRRSSVRRSTRRLSVRRSRRSVSRRRSPKMSRRRSSVRRSMRRSSVRRSVRRSPREGISALAIV